MRKIVALLLTILLINGCREEVVSDIIVYGNDFESENSNGISNYLREEFNGSNVLGSFHASGFDLSLNTLPEHTFLLVKFDLLIHDAWDGNKVGVDGPDFWTLQLKDDLRETKVTDYEFRTTFSTSPCGTVHCVFQSYPNQYPFSNLPDFQRDGSTNGRCFEVRNPESTSIYKIERYIPHESATAFLSIFDEGKQDNIDTPSCDESWSIDNLLIRAINR
ncbi:MAG: hypothetical protein R8G66_27635 [Cytophagales bacterium]|nr:hypothetical protein [Cytophagales bacterium]